MMRRATCNSTSKSRLKCIMKTIMHSGGNRPVTLVCDNVMPDFMQRHDRVLWQ